MTKRKNPKNEPAAPADPPAEPQPPIYDPAAGKAAFESLAEQRKAVRTEQLVSTRLDIEAAVLAALGVYAFATAEPLYSRFKKLHSIGELDIGSLDKLKGAAFAVLYALSAAKIAGALRTEPKIPVSLIEKATATERRMQGVCEYHFKNDPEIAKELDRLRPGSGYRDIAGDLLGYARIYGLRTDVVAKDPTNYLATDKADAEQMAGEILALLAADMSPKARIAYEQLLACWTLLCGMYDDVRAAGLYLTRKDPKSPERFPSLFTAARLAASRTKHTKKGAEQAEGQAGDKKEEPK